MIELSDRWANTRARDVQNVCYIADRMDLVPRYLESTLSVSEILQQLLWLRTSNVSEADGGSVALPN